MKKKRFQHQNLTPNTLSRKSGRTWVSRYMRRGVQPGPAQASSGTSGACVRVPSPQIAHAQPFFPPCLPARCRPWCPLRASLDGSTGVLHGRRRSGNSPGGSSAGIKSPLLLGARPGDGAALPRPVAHPPLEGSLLDPAFLAFARRGGRLRDRSCSFLARSSTGG